MTISEYNGHTFELPDWPDVRDYLEFQQDWDSLWTVVPRYYPEDYQRSALFLPIPQAWALARCWWLTANGLKGKSPFYESMRELAHYWVIYKSEGRECGEVPFTPNQVHFLRKGKQNAHAISEATRQAEAWEAFGGQPWIDSGAWSVRQVA